MKKKPSTLVNMVLSLGLISIISALCLGLVNEITKEPIALAKKAKQETAIRQVLPSFDRIEDDTLPCDGENILLHRAFTENQWVGTAIETFSPNGFGGTVKLMVGLLPDGKIREITVLEHHETPGLGDKMDASKSNFALQFKNQDPKSFILKVKKDGGSVDAITAATISSRAYCDAVSRAVTVSQSSQKLAK